MVRLSGPESIEITEKVFSKTLKNTEANRAVFGLIKDREKTIDEVVAVVYRAPHSFTGENSVEITCHASPYIQHEIVRLLLKNGAHLASEGEFSLRAYLNGKMDLSQAEAIADIIASESAASHRLAMNQMRGGYSDTINTLREELIDFASLIELELDFAEEDVEFADRTRLTNLVKRILKMTQGLAGTFQLGNAIKKGIPVAIVGEPNVGKSTLLNALLNEDRAIVSEIAGTTRDTIEDYLVIAGIQFRFIDTAGIRKTTDTIETFGIERTLAKVDDASIILCMVDASKDDREAIEQEVNYISERIEGKNKHLIVVANKSDLVNKNDFGKFSAISNRFPVVFLSAKQNEGIQELKSDLSRFIQNDPLSQQQVIITNIRHYDALKKTEQSLFRVREALKIGISGDLVAMDIREAIYHLGEITGTISTDDLLGNIFSKFCIGK